MRPASFIRLGALALCFAVADVLHAQSSTLVFIVRHGEKAAQPAADPPLTAEGTARAQALADVLANANVGAIISTPYLRTVETALPTARRSGVKIDSVAVRGGVDAHARAVAEAVRAHAGKTVLVVGHSNTIMAIAAALGVPRLPDLCDEEHDRLVMVELPPTGPPRLVISRYGAPSPAGTCNAMR